MYYNDKDFIIGPNFFRIPKRWYKTNSTMQNNFEAYFNPTHNAVRIPGPGSSSKKFNHSQISPSNFIKCLSNQKIFPSNSRFIEPGWSIPGSRHRRYNVKGTPRNSTAETTLLGSTNLIYRFWISCQALRSPKIAGRTNLSMFKIQFVSKIPHAP